MPQVAKTFIQIIAFDLYPKATRTGSLSSLYTTPSSTRHPPVHNTLQYTTPSSTETLSDFVISLQAFGNAHRCTQISGQQNNFKTKTEVVSPHFTRGN